MTKLWFFLIIPTALWINKNENTQKNRHAVGDSTWVYFMFFEVRGSAATSDLLALWMAGRCRVEQKKCSCAQRRQGWRWANSAWPMRTGQFVSFQQHFLETRIHSPFLHRVFSWGWVQLDFFSRAVDRSAAALWLAGCSSRKLSSPLPCRRAQTPMKNHRHQCEPNIVKMVFFWRFFLQDVLAISYHLLVIFFIFFNFGFFRKLRSLGFCPSLCGSLLSLLRFWSAEIDKKSEEAKRKKCEFKVTLLILYE